MLISRKLRDAFNRAAIIPFETAVGFLVLVAGIFGLLRYGIIDPVATYLPHWEATAVNSVYMLSGAGIVTGIFTDRGTIEAFGLWLLSGSVIVRFILLGKYLGFGQNFIMTGSLDILFLGAAVIRMYHIRKKHIIIKASDNTNGVEKIGP